MKKLLLLALGAVIYRAYTEAVAKTVESLTSEDDDDGEELQVDQSTESYDAKTGRLKITGRPENPEFN